MGRNSHSNEDSEWRRKKEVQEAKGGCVLQLLGLVVVGIIFFAMCDGKPKPKPVPTVAP